MKLIIPRNEYFSEYKFNSSLSQNIHDLFLTKDNNLIRPDTKTVEINQQTFSYGLVVITPRGIGRYVGFYGNKFWFQLECDHGKVSYWGRLVNLLNNNRFVPTMSFREPRNLTYYEFMNLVYQFNTHGDLDLNIHSSFVFPNVDNIFRNSLNELKRRRAPNDNHDFFSRLPPEMVAEIASHLPPIYVFHLSLMCKSWYSLFRNDVIWKRFLEKYHILVNRAILTLDYKNNIIQYFFSHGIRRILHYRVSSQETLGKLNNTLVLIGGLYWNLLIIGRALYIRLMPISMIEKFKIKIAAVQLLEDNGAEHHRAIQINNYETNYFLFPLPSVQETSFRFLIFVPIKNSLISLLHSLH